MTSTQKLEIAKLTAKSQETPTLNTARTHFH